MYRDATVLSSNPLRWGLFTADGADREKRSSERRLLLSIKLCHRMRQKKSRHSSIFPFLSSRSLPFHPLFFRHDVRGSRLSFSSPSLSPPVLTSHFLFPPVNINTRLMCTPRADVCPWRTDSPHCWARTSLFFCTYTSNPEAFSYLFSAPGNDRQALWLFTLSESQRSVTSDRFRLLKTEVWMKAYTWRIAASYVTFETPRDMSLSMNSLCEYGSSPVNAQFYKPKCKSAVYGQFLSPWIAHSALQLLLLLCFSQTVHWN